MFNVDLKYGEPPAVNEARREKFYYQIMLDLENLANLKILNLVGNPLPDNMAKNYESQNAIERDYSK